MQKYSFLFSLPLIMQFQYPTPEGVQTHLDKPSFKLGAFSPHDPLILCNV